MYNVMTENWISISFPLSQAEYGLFADMVPQQNGHVSVSRNFRLISGQGGR